MFEFLQSLSDFFLSGIYTWFEETAKYLITTLMIWFIEGQIWSLEFAWEIAQGVISSLNISDQIVVAFNGLPGDVLNGVRFFKIPEALNLLFTALVTRLVLNMVPFL